MKNYISIKSFCIFFLFANNFLSTDVAGQIKESKNLYNYAQNILASKKLNLLECQPFHIDTINKMIHQSLQIKGNKIELVYDTTSLTEEHPEPLSYFIINNKKANPPIYAGNTFKFSEKISNGLSFKIAPKFFSINSTNYIIIPCSFRNCNGSACRVTVYYLIRFTPKYYEIYYFKNEEIPFQSLFRIDKKNNLYFLNIVNSFSDIDYFTHQEQEYITLHDTTKYLKISPLLFNPVRKKWSKLKDQNGKEYYILIAVLDLDWSYNKEYKVIKSFWPKDM